jgi:hypothetical protein
LYLSGDKGWSSVAYNAHRNAAGNAWVFPDPTRPAMTIEMDDAGGPGRFQVWSTTRAATQVWTGPHLMVAGETGNVGVGTGNPVARMHVVGGSSGPPEDVQAHAALIENPTNSVAADVLALRLQTPFLGDSNNFITFLRGNQAVGAIEGDGSGGIVFDTPGADWAEWLPLADGEEPLEPGEVVGVHGGAVSRRTDGADHVMVVSTAPGVVSNRPPDEQRHRHARIALLGQAPVKVRGSVRPGDHLLATGDDGVAEARDPGEVPLADHARCVGIAWEGEPGEDGEVRAVRAAVGTRPSAGWVALADEVRRLGEEISALHSASEERRTT